MKLSMTRKSFIGATLATAALGRGVAAVPSTDGRRWYRGMLHMHSHWSDGRALPEQAVAAYKDVGYDFIALSDHNRFQDNPDKWMAVGNGTEKGLPPVRLCASASCCRRSACSPTGRVAAETEDIDQRGFFYYNTGMGSPEQGEWLGSLVEIS